MNLILLSRDREMVRTTARLLVPIAHMDSTLYEYGSNELPIYFDHLLASAPELTILNLKVSTEGTAREDRIRYGILTALQEFCTFSPISGAPPYKLLLEVADTLYKAPTPISGIEDKYLTMVRTHLLELGSDVYLKYVTRRLSELKSAYNYDSDTEYAHYMEQCDDGIADPDVIKETKHHCVVMTDVLPADIEEIRKLGNTIVVDVTNEGGSKDPLADTMVESIGPAELREELHKLVYLHLTGE